MTAYDDSVLLDAPIGYWPLEDGSGTTADLSGNGLHGTVTGGVTRSPAGFTFDGSTGYVDLGEQSLLRDLEEFTIEAWCVTNTVGRFVYRWGGHGHFLRLTGEGSQVGGFYDELTTGYVAGSGTGKADGELHHLTLTFDGSTLRLRDNKNQAGITENITAVPYYSDGGSAIGREGPFPSGWWDGVIRRVAIYGYVLPDARLDAHYDLAMAEEGPLATPVLSLSRTNPSTQGASDGVALIQWPDVPGAATYEVAQASGNTQEPEDFVVLTDTLEESEYEVTGLSAGTYTWRVQAQP